MAAPVDPYDFQNLVSIIDAAQVNLRFKTLFDALDKTRVGLDGSSFKDGAFTAAKFPALAWSTVALGGGPVWTPANLSYHKDTMGVIRFRPEAFAISTTLAQGATLATLPAGARPAVDSAILLLGVRGTVLDTCVATVTTAGAVVLTRVPGGASLPAASKPVFFGAIRDS